MKTTQGEITELLWWGCPYKNCITDNEEEVGSMGDFVILKCRGCDREVKIII